MGAKLFIRPTECETKMSKNWHGLSENAWFPWQPKWFENGGLSTKLLISQLLFIIDFFWDHGFHCGTLKLLEGH